VQKLYQKAVYEGIVSDSDHLSGTLSIGTPLNPYGIAYRRVYGLSTSGLFKKSLCSPLCGSARYNHMSKRVSARPTLASSGRDVPGGWRVLAQNGRPKPTPPRDPPRDQSPHQEAGPLSLFGLTVLVRPGSFPLQSWRICTADPACQLENSLTTRLRQS
jgi:hypothetical protein